MKQNLITLTLLLAAFMVPLITSLLLEWQFIARAVSRQIIVYLFMAAQFLTVLLMAKYYITKK